MKKLLKPLSLWTVSWLSALVIVLLRWTCRIRRHNDPRPALREEQRNYAYSVLHAHQVAAVMDGERGTAAMVSRSGDGQIIIPALRCRGIVPVRGSSAREGTDKGGQTAFNALVRHMETGAPGYLAVDGPRGPRNEVKKGIALLAQKTNAAVVNVMAVPSRRWILSKSWDRMQIPKPFTTIDVYFAEPLTMQDGEELEAFRQRIEDSLNALEERHDGEEAQRAREARQARR